MPFLIVNQPWGSGGMLLRESLKLRSSEITRNVYFSIYFASSKFSKRATKLHRKGHFVRDFEKRGHMPPVPPCVPGSYVHALNYITAEFNG